MTLSEHQIEAMLIEELRNLKYVHREDISDRATLEKNFRDHFQSLNRVNLTDAESHRLLEEIVTPDVFTAQTLRGRNAFTRDDGTPLNYTLVNISDWCKNTFEIVNQLRVNTDYSHHRYDVVLLISGVPVVQIELKTLGINPRRAMEQVVEYKNDPGNGNTRTLLCFVQLFVVSNRTDTWCFANNNARHFSFKASTLLKANPAIEKCLVVVDRKVVEHIQCGYQEGELDEAATCRNFRQVRAEGERQVVRDVPRYNRKHFPCGEQR